MSFTKKYLKVLTTSIQKLFIFQESILLCAEIEKFYLVEGLCDDVVETDQLAVFSPFFTFKQRQGLHSSECTLYSEVVSFFSSCALEFLLCQAV
jgi:hypothetical protein